MRRGVAGGRVCLSDNENKGLRVGYLSSARELISNRTFRISSPSWVKVSTGDPHHLTSLTNASFVKIYSVIKVIRCAHVILTYFIYFSSHLDRTRHRRLPQEM